MGGITRLSARSMAAGPRLGGSPLTIATGYPWVDGDILYAADLNAAFLPVTGITDGSYAAAGQVGQVVTAGTGSPGGAIATGTFSAITSITLTPGDWDISGFVATAPGAGCIVTDLQFGPSASTTAFTGYDPCILAHTAAAGVGDALPIIVQHSNIAISAMAYLLVFAVFSGGTCNSFGRISARRMR